MRKIYTASDHADAELMCQELKAEGIDAVVQDEKGPIVTAPFPSIWVPLEDVDRANELLDELRGETGRS